MRRALPVAGILLALPLFAQNTQSAKPAVIEIKGRIDKVGITRGQGMPSLEVRAESGKIWKVWLGSMRYLMEQNFNPKAGEEVEVKGFQATGNEMTAQTVTLTATKRTIQLRDDQGLPLWRGPMRGGPRGRWMR